MLITRTGVMALYPNIPDYLKFNWFLSPLGPANSALLDNEFDHDFNGTMYLKQVGMPLQGQTWTPVYYLFGFLVRMCMPRQLTLVAGAVSNTLLSSP